MSQCSHCASDNLDDARFCASCGGRIEAVPQPPAQPLPAAYPPIRGMAAPSAPPPARSYPAIRGMAQAIGPELAHHPAAMEAFPSGTASAQAGQRFAANKNATLASVLSFIFPGGGQFYNGDIKKGFAILGVAFVAYWLSINGGWIVGVPISLANLVWAMMDANKVARQQKALW